MGIEVFAAVAAALLTSLLVLPLSLGAVGPIGLPTLLGNRENMPELTGWRERARRAHANALESLLPFAIVAIAVQLADASNEISRLASLAFLAARVIHGLSYLSGVLGLRTLAWNAGLIATFATVFPFAKSLPF
ncbi:MAG: MAPEG family protein [bacterium]